MFLGAVTYDVLKDYDLDSLIKILQTTGFEAVELRTQHKHGVEPSLSAAERASVKSRFAQSKVRLLSYGSTCEFHSPDPKVREKNTEDCKKFIDLAHDTGAWAVKVRPNGISPELGPEKTFATIGECLKTVGDYGSRMGVEIWMEVHGRETQVPTASAAILKAAKHDNVGACWNSNPTDIVNGSLKDSFKLLRPYIKNCHINELAGPYPYRELFTLLRDSKYDRYTLCEAQASKEPERFLRWYKALWTELNRKCV